MAPYFELVFNIPSDRSFTYQIDDKSEAAIGKRAMVPFGKRDCLGYIIAQRDDLPEGVTVDSVKKIRRVVDKEGFLFGDSDIQTARWMAGFYLCSAGQALAAMIPSGRKIITPSLPQSDEENANALSLSDEQAVALNAINSGISAAGTGKSAGMFYLFGITGSGKTEVFLRASQFALNAGRSVIYLVPEISLTRQTAKMIEERFGSLAATLHSGMSPSSRLAEWMRIRAGKAPIVIGPRSAVFAPVPNLGLVIIDEEHDGSYKSGSTPRYHARQVALRRCSQEGAVIVMGSATPSVEAWKLMSEGGIKRLDLTRRLSGGRMPQIIPVSLVKTQGCLTKELKDEILSTARMGKQSILFLNRRGFAHFYQCPDCGWEQLCRRCSVSLTWHKSRSSCICHYCGYSEPPPASCPKCGSVQAGYRGFGTEMIEEEVRQSFPDLRLCRVDADTAGKNKKSPSGNLEETLTQFKAGMIDILLGTQMVAKGLNFPGVRLVGVIFADTGLNMPDFRAAERTFSLIVQVAGRAGRYFPDSKVIVQTLRMEDPVIKKSCAMDVSGFYNAELAQRRALNFPPFSRIIRFTVRAREEKRASEAINRLASLAEKILPKGADMLGPAECPIGVINNNHRKHIILRSADMGSLHAAVRRLLENYEKGRDAKTYLEADVDPVSML
ncbi:MAG: primosomal protein N' [Treponema sp.]|nr:primosomal protein N' [Treponema sp.]MCL2272151.1 primosomal protein N' [Treponema sp.]